MIYPINLFFYYVFKFMKKNVNLKPSQEYPNVSKKINHSKIIYIISIFVIKYSLSYKHISRGHINP